MELKSKFEVKRNELKQGIELYFSEFPTKKEREDMKANGLKWSGFNKCWYIKESKSPIINGIDYKGSKELAKSENTNQETKPQIKQVSHNLKVGDILASSWGYEQTNNSFFRVEELKGSTMVRVREVYLGIKETSACSGMSEDRIYNLNDYTYVKNSVFIKDNEKGITRKVKNHNQDKSSGDFIEVDSVAYAYKLHENEKMYCSWYY